MNKEDIEIWLKKYAIKRYTINSDLSVDVLGDVNLSKLPLSELPFKFGSVKGIFSISDCLFTTLKNVNLPYYADVFIVRNNQLKSLEGCPQTQTLNASYNQLKDLMFLPSGCQRLIVSHNQLSGTLDFYTSMIGSLDIRNNCVEKLILPTQMQELKVGGNPIEKIEGLVEIFYDLDISIQHINDLLVYQDITFNQKIILDKTQGLQLDWNCASYPAFQAFIQPLALKEKLNANLGVKEHKPKIKI